MAEGDLAAIRRKIRAQLGVLGVDQRGVGGVGHRKGVEQQNHQNHQKYRTESEITSKQQGKDSVLLTDSDYQEEISSFRSPLIQTLSHMCDQLLMNPSSTSTTSDWYTTIHLFLTEFFDDDGLKNSRKICRRYVDRLEGLVGFQLALMGGPTGLHGHFLSMNIDAITLRPVRIRRKRVGVVEDEDEINIDVTTTATNDAATVTAAAATTANTPSSPSSNPITTPTTTTPTTPITTAPEVYNLAHMTAEGLLRLSSGIHEELHHSLWMYLLMGSRHFVGKYYTTHIHTYPLDSLLVTP